MNPVVRIMIFLVALFLIVVSVTVAWHRVATSPSGNVVEVEREDCDAEDRARGEWWECPNVLKTTKAPAPKKSPAKVNPPKPQTSRK